MKTPPPNQTISAYSRHKTAIATLFFIFSSGTNGILAQLPPPISESGLNTQVSGAINNGGNIQYNITGGTRPNNGGNLFHSFGEFGVPLNNIANFQNDSGLPTTNILSRVTGNNPSNIFGTIRTEGFGDTNLFLMNPNGVVFGPNAMLDVSGSFHVSTADSIRLGTDTGGGLFSSSDTGVNLLTSAPPSAFGFSDSNPLSSISVRGANLRVQPGKVISIIGGDVDSTPQNNPQGDVVSDSNPGIIIADKSTISAPQGQINLVSVAAPGTVTTTGLGLTPDFPLSAFNQLGTVKITDQSVIDVEGNGGGNIVIRGGRLTLDRGALITTSTLGPNDAGTVSINASENVTLDGAVIGAETTGRGSGDAGHITIAAGNDVVLKGITENSGRTGKKFSSISSSAREFSDRALGDGLLGSGGTITIAAQNLTLNGGAEIIAETVGDNSVPPAVAFLNGTELSSSGTVDLTATDTLTLSDTIFDGNEISPSKIAVGVKGSGPATVGDITVKAGTINILKGAEISASTESTTSATVQGSLSVEATETLTVDGFQGRASQETFDQDVRISGIRAQTTGPNKGADIMIHTKNLVLSNGGQIDSTPTTSENPVESRGAGGNITVEVTEDLTISGRANGREFSDQSSILSVARASGKAGDISITAANLTLENGGLIATNSQPQPGVVTPGPGGRLTIAVKEDLTVSGVNTEIVDRPLASRISSGTESAAKAGDISLVANNITVANGGIIRANTSSSGLGGKLRLMAKETLTVSGVHTDFEGTASESTISSSTAAIGMAGDIDITATKVDVNAGGEISSNSGGRGSGDAGNITIRATEDVVISGNSQVIRAGKTETVFSEISSGVSEFSEGGLGEGLLGSGGTITIDAQNLSLNGGAKIIAKTVGDDASPPATEFLHGAELPSSGTVNITVADTLTISDTNFAGNEISPSEISVGVTGAATVGTIEVQANTINILKGGEISASTASKTRSERQGNILVTAGETLTVSGFQGRTSQEIPGQDIRISGIRAQTTGPNDGANIMVKAKNLFLSNGGTIDSTPTIASEENAGESRGAGANITVEVTEGITISGRANGRAQGDQSAILSVARASGKAGDISVTAANLSLENGGLITTNSQPQPSVVTPGPGGRLTIAVKEDLTVSGVNTEIVNRPLASRISSGTQSAAKAGDISLVANNITVANGGTVAASSAGEGNGGFINLNATDTVSVRGGSTLLGKTTESRVSSISTKKGNSGTITIAAETIAIQDGARVTTSAEGIGNPGNIELVNAKEIQLVGGIVETEAAQTSGGNIKLMASDLIFLHNSQILSSVDGNGTTQGGNISIDPDFIVLINSQIRADAAVGDGGTISLVANTIFRDSLTTITAKSGFEGVDGSVNIQAPIQNLSQAIAPLPETIVEVAALYSAQCAGQKNGQFSSFTQQGLDRLPHEPGELLPTPLFFPDLTSDQSKKPNTASSPMVRRLQLPSFDSDAYLASIWDISQGGCRS